MNIEIDSRKLADLNQALASAKLYVQFAADEARSPEWRNLSNELVGRIDALLAGTIFSPVFTDLARGIVKGVEQSL